jgi:hypothetical protein
MKDPVHVRCSRAWCERLIKLVLTDYRSDRGPKARDARSRTPRAARSRHATRARPAQRAGDAQTQRVNLYRGLSGLIRAHALDPAASQPSEITVLSHICGISMNVG